MGSIDSITYRRFIIFAGLIVTLLGMLVILGWLTGISILTSIVPGYYPMRFKTAFCVAVLGMALLNFKFNNKVGTPVTRILALLITTCCSVALVQEILAYTTHNYPLFNAYKQTFSENYIHPGGMSALTAICFGVVATSVFIISTSKHYYKTVLQYCLHIVTLVAFVVLIGYIFNVPVFYRLSYFTAMPFTTAIALLLLSVAISLLNPDKGIAAIFSGNLIGNVMARKLFLPMLTAILSIAYLHFLNSKYQWIEKELSIALLTISFIIIVLLLIWQTCTLLNKLHLNKKVAVENFRLGVESSPHALIISDANSNIVHINPHAEKLYGYSRKELAGNNLEVLIPEKLRQSYRNMNENFFKSPKVISLGIDEELFAKHKDGTEFPIELVLTPVKTSKGNMVLTSITDITQRKTNESIIKTQLIELKVKNRELEHFNYIASHDLQEPLRTVSNYIMLLEEDYPELISPNIKAHLQAMSAATGRMSHLVRSLLDFGKLGNNRTLTLTNCTVLVNNVIADLNSLITSNNALITITTELPLLYAYDTELRQLFQNLINNAIKFGKKGQQPQIQISCTKHNGFFIFEVNDNGIGIDAEHREGIFNIFERLHKNDDFEGYGIGLANCKKVADMHGGKIWVESEPGNGSTFKFTIAALKP